MIELEAYPVLFLGDAAIAASLFLLAIHLFTLIRACCANLDPTKSSAAFYEHNLAHLIPAVIGFAGCLIGAVSAVAHMWLDEGGAYTEIAEAVGVVGYIMIFVCAILIFDHMLDENMDL